MDIVPLILSLLFFVLQGGLALQLVICFDDLLRERMVVEIFVFTYDESRNEKATNNERYIKFQWRFALSKFGGKLKKHIFHDLPLLANPRAGSNHILPPSA